MVISEPGLICLESSERHLVRGFVSLWFGARDTPSISASPAPPHALSGVGTARIEPGSGATLAGAFVAAGIESTNEQEGGLVDEVSDDNVAMPLTARERRARAAALRGLLLGRQRRFGAAQAAFTEAAQLDPTLHLDSVPTFWNLERGAHEAAVGAYEEAGRTHDAAMLASRLRTTFRPRLLQPRSTTPSTVG